MKNSGYSRADNMMMRNMMMCQMMADIMLFPAISYCYSGKSYT